MDAISDTAEILDKAPIGSVKTNILLWDVAPGMICIYASGLTRAGAVNKLHDSLSAKET